MRTFIIKCEDGKFYVDESNDIKKRYKDHIAGKVLFSKKYQPIEIFEITDASVDGMVLTYMFRFGIKNVRGGKYSTMDLTEDEIKFIESEIYSSDKCFRCGKDGHWSNHCPRQIKKEIPLWQRCLSVFSSAYDDMFSECKRCGRNHSTKECRAFYHVHGFRI